MSKEAVAEFATFGASIAVQKELIAFAAQRDFPYDPDGLTDPALVEKWRDLVVEFARLRGFEFTADELADDAQLEEGELSDAELEMVAGGAMMTN